LDRCHSPDLCYMWETFGERIAALRGYIYTPSYCGDAEHRDEEPNTVPESCKSPRVILTKTNLELRVCYREKVRGRQNSQPTTCSLVLLDVPMDLHLFGRTGFVWPYNVS
ncbi:hypothetical protein M404DRAFT_1008722, partial [Pisolithus tinctorius Marx 270]